MFNKQANKLRRLMEEKELLIGCGARDALDAKLVENASFDFVWSSSLGVSASFGVPDSSLISMNQYIAAASSMAEVVDIPIIIDADTGYGNVNNVIYAVKKFSQVGLAAMSMEDKKFPKECSLLPAARHELVSIEEFCGKIKAAKDSQQGDDFVVIARVEALISGLGQKEAMKRAVAYADAGADCILIHSKAESPHEILEFVEAWDGRAPIVLVPTTYPQLTQAKIKKLGKIKIVIYANQTFRAAVKATHTLLKKIKKAEGIHTIDDLLVPVSHIFELQGVPEMQLNEKKYSR